MAYHSQVTINENIQSCLLYHVHWTRLTGQNAKPSAHSAYNVRRYGVYFPGRFSLLRGLAAFVAMFSHISCPECWLSLLFSAPLGVFNDENNRIRSLLQQNTTGKRKAKCETQNSSAERNAKRKTQAQNAKRNAKRKTQARSAKRKTVSFSASVALA